MATQITPSKRAAADIEALKMESPLKQPIFFSEEKENVEVAVPIKGLPELDELPEPVAPSVAPTINDDEAVEPILQENGQRFVLFPIKYHEASHDALRTRKYYR
ncbi:Ribonucleotide-diphosphate reductase (RNR), small subunit [Elasticomyces elasticus]|nr:Ribonucleotide-diphosphate reductase (RNR), small subunit [Elasticomyces elasticus]